MGYWIIGLLFLYRHPSQRHNNLFLHISDLGYIIGFYSMPLKEKPSAAELRHIYGDLRKKELHEFKISKRAISSFGAPGFVYEERMNLPSEFSC